MKVCIEVMDSLPYIETTSIFRWFHSSYSLLNISVYIQYSTKAANKAAYTLLSILYL